jgi:hypothetical protein
MEQKEVPVHRTRYGSDLKVVVLKSYLQDLYICIWYLMLCIREILKATIESDIPVFYPQLLLQNLCLYILFFSRSTVLCSSFLCFVFK